MIGCHWPNTSASSRHCVKPDVDCLCFAYLNLLSTGISYSEQKEHCFKLLPQWQATTSSMALSELFIFTHCLLQPTLQPSFTSTTASNIQTHTVSFSHIVQAWLFPPSLPNRACSSPQIHNLAPPSTTQHITDGSNNNQRAAPRAP